MIRRAARDLRARSRSWIAASPAPARMRVAALIGPGNPNAFFIAPDLSFLYVAVPKAANSTIKRALLALRGIDIDDADAMRALRTVKDPYLRLPDLNGAQAALALKGSATFRFTFVRNPYDRMISAYKDKILGLNRNHPAGFEANLFGGARRPPSFAEYVRTYTAIDDWRSDIHWRSQYRNAATDVISYDLIGRVETFENDFRGALKRIAPDVSPERLIRPTNISPEPSTWDPGDPTCPAYTQELAHLVYRRYARDFQLFGYDAGSYAGGQSIRATISSPVSGGLK